MRNPIILMMLCFLCSCSVKAPEESIFSTPKFKENDLVLYEGNPYVVQSKLFMFPTEPMKAKLVSLANSKNQKIITLTELYNKGFYLGEGINNFDRKHPDIYTENSVIRWDNKAWVVYGFLKKKSTDKTYYELFVLGKHTDRKVVSHEHIKDNSELVGVLDINAIDNPK